MLFKSHNVLTRQCRRLFSFNRNTWGMASKPGNQQKSQNVSTAWMFSAPRSQSSQLGTSSTVRACLEPFLLFQNWECSCEIPPTFNYSHDELKPINNSIPSRVNFSSPCNEKVFKGAILIPSIPSEKYTLAYSQGSSSILKVNHSKAIQFWCVFMGYCPQAMLSHTTEAIRACKCNFYLSLFLLYSRHR